MITLPKLPYAYDALEPFIDKETMQIHHTKHHQAYIDKVNTVLQANESLQNKTVEHLLSTFSDVQIGEKDKTILRNFGGGHANHAFFWNILGPKKEIDAILSEEIIQSFGSIQSFKDAFTEGALKHFGSGWMWLVKNSQGKLELYSTSNQDSPLMSGHTPLITLDLWEHAYYLKYQNKKAEYFNAWWNVLRIIE